MREASEIATEIDHRTVAPHIHLVTRHQLTPGWGCGGVRSGEGADCRIRVTVHEPCAVCMALWRAVRTCVLRREHELRCDWLSVVELLLS